MSYLSLAYVYYLFYEINQISGVARNFQ